VPQPPSDPTAGRHRAARRLLAALLSCAALLVTACGDDDPAASGSGGSSGRTLYEQNCAACHGKDLRGTDRGPSHLSEVYKPSHHPDASFEAAIRSGSQQHHWDFGDMPPVEGLDDDEVAAIIAYVRDQQAEQGFEPYPPG
jgi:mono/diheme cytochrome c family protein